MIIGCHEPGARVRRVPSDSFAATLLSGQKVAGSEDKLRRISRTVSLAAGKAARLADRADHFAFVESGATKLVAQASADREQVVAFHFSGDLASIPARGTRHYSLVALDPTQLIVVEASRLLAIARDEPGILAVLLEQTTQALRRSREKSVNLGRNSAEERVAGFVATMAARIGRADGRAFEMRMPMCRRDIADALGLTIETVSRQFSEMRVAGLIETSGRSWVRVRDIGRLHARAGLLAGMP